MTVNIVKLSFFAVADERRTVLMSVIKNLKINKQT